MKSLAVAVSFYSLLTLSVQAINVTVGQLGVVSGYQETENNVIINIFKGIPFAQPPVGNLRFARPQPLTTFPSPVVNATQPPNTCYSVNTAATPLNEDCLYLNIFAPNSSSADATGRAVMIWIYGGTFSSGSSANPAFDGRVLAAYGDVILVSINYRVGVLGFLYLNTTDVPGNVGLLDQQMAIQWVHDNIQYFGGDANRITVFGESAGAMSTGLQLLSPLNRGIITRAIMESGCGQTPGAYNTPVQALAASLSIVNVSSCASLNTNLTAVVACLKQMDTSTVVQLLKKVRYVPPTLLPTTDNYFLTDNPNNLLAQGRGVNIAGILLGTNTYEGRFLIERIFPQLKNGSVVADVNLFNEEVAFYVSSPLGKMAVTFEYTEPAASLGQPVDYKIAAADVEGDFNFVCPASKASDGYAALGKSVYRYQFNHVTVGSLPAWMGATHTSEIDYVFGKPLASWNTAVNYTADEKQFSLQMVLYWTNFAKTGNPNIGNLQQPSVSLAQWPLYTTDNQTYLSLDTNFTYGHFLSAQRCTFCNKYLPQLYSYETSLTSPPLTPPPTTPPIVCVTSKQPSCSSAILSATSTFSVFSLLAAITLHHLLM